MLVTSAWLKKELDNSNLIILDASQPNKQNNLEGLQIRGARYFDLKKAFSNTESSFPNSFPSKKKFEISCRELGVNNTSAIIVYDKMGVFSSARVWWMFKTMGHENIRVLDGGLPDWLLHKYQTEIPTQKKYTTGNFKANFEATNIRYFDFIKQNINTKKALVIDARSSDRFLGIVPEPREKLASGHISNSINIHFKQVLKNGKFKSKKELTKVFSNIKTNKELVFSCGSGVTACILLMASTLILDNKKSIYDGSWTEYATLDQ